MSAPARLLACLLPAVLAGSACDVAMSADGIDGAFERNLTVSGPLELEVGSGSGDIVVRPAQRAPCTSRGGCAPPPAHS